MATRKPGTAAIANHAVEVRQAPVRVPIYQTSTFELDREVYDAVDRGDLSDVFLYSRHGNPTVAAAQRKVAELEGTEAALLLSSGMAAIATALTALARPGSVVVAPRQLYGTTWTLLAGFLTDWGVQVRWADLDGPLPLDGGEGRPIVYLETLTNPLLDIPDLGLVVARAHDAGALVVVDNTFLGPMCLRPADVGVDLVIESGTKYLGGHSDIMCGAVAGSAELVHACWRQLLLLGGCCDPNVAFLLDRGISTLHLRTAAHCANAQAVAERLEAHPAVRWVRYPGLASHPGRDRTAGWSGHGGMVAFGLADDDAALAFLSRVRVFVAAASLGGVESLVCLPMNTSHPTAEQRAAIGLEPGTVRLSVGCEDIADLLADLEAALC